MSTIYCSTCGKKVLRSQLSEHNLTEHPRGSTSRSGESGSIDNMAKLLLLQMEENKRLQQQDVSRKRSQSNTKSDTDEKSAKRLKVRRYNYQDFCVSHINPGDCFTQNCEKLNEYIASHATSPFTFCGKHNALHDCFTFQCATLRLWFLQQIEKKEEDDPEVGKNYYSIYLRILIISYCSIIILLISQFIYLTVTVLAEIEAKRQQIDKEEDERKHQFIAARQRYEEERTAAEIERKQAIEREANKRFEEMMKTYKQAALQSKPTDKSNLLATPIPQRPPKPIKFVKESFTTAATKINVPQTSHPSTSKIVPSQKTASEQVLKSDDDITIEEYVTVLDECDKGNQ